MAVFVLSALIYWVFFAPKMAKSPKAHLFALGGLFCLSALFYMVVAPAPSLKGFLNNTPAEWGVFLGALALLFAYSALLRKLKARARALHSASHGEAIAHDASPVELSEGASPLSSAEIERYQRHILVKEIGGAGQKALKSASVLVIGAGGLGAPTLLYLGAAGVGRIGIVDDDVVSLSNLQRQIIHREASLGESKAFSAAAALEGLNPLVETRLYRRRLAHDWAGALFSEYDLILECSDNYQTRTLSNEAAFAAQKPLIVGAVGQWDGEVGLYHPLAGAPCYLCAQPHAPPNAHEQSCAQAGVAGPLVGVIGSVMGLEALKYITQSGTSLAGRLLLYDGLEGRCRVIELTRRRDCPLCGQGS